MALPSILPQNPGLGERFGTGLGEGLGGALQALANMKLNEVTQRQHAKSLQGLHPGLTPELAGGILSLPQKSIPSVLAAILEELNQSGNPEAAAQIQNQLPKPEPTGMQSLSGFNVANLLSSPNINPLLRNALSQIPIPPGMASSQQKQQNAQQMQAQPQVQQQAAPQPEVRKPNISAAIARGLQGGSKEADRESKIQSNIDKQNAPYLKGLTKAVDNAETTVNALNTMEKLLDTGNVTYGIYGASTPYVFLSPESQQFDKEANTLAQQLAGQTGVPTGFKIKFAQTQKPNLTDSPETQRNRIRSLRKEAQKILDKGAIRDELIEANGGNQPKNLETLINKRYHEQEKNGGKKSFADLPDASLYTGKIATSKKTGQKLISNGTEWLPVEE